MFIIKLKLYIVTQHKVIKQSVQWHVKTTLHFLPVVHCVGNTTAPGGLINFFLSKHSLSAAAFVSVYSLI